MTTPQIKKIDGIEFTPCSPGTQAYMRVLLGQDDDMPHFYSREFKIDPGGAIPRHRHANIEHQQIVLEGTLSLQLNEDWTTVSEGHCVYIPEMTIHAYKNNTEKPVRFICIVPRTAEYKTEWM